MPFTFRVPSDVTVSTVLPVKMLAVLPVATTRPPVMLPDVLREPAVTLAPELMLLPVRVAVPPLTTIVPNDALGLPSKVPA